MASTLDTIAQLMNEPGPTVAAVMLKADGTTEQITIDTSPKANAAATLLKGNPTFIGQFSSLNVVVMCSKVTADEWTVNQHKLPNPFSKIEVKGDVLLLRVNDDAVPTDFHIDEWTRFTAEREEFSSPNDGEDYGPLQISASELIDQIDDVAEDDDEDDEEFEAEDDEEESDEEEDDEEEDEAAEAQADMDQEEGGNVAAKPDRSEL